jgi:ubiquinone/menaquinone biosynthesis C-methylase UbiE
MNVKESYNIWAKQYDTNDNKTRDLEARALRENLANIEFTSCLEIGCGTGKNTGWLLSKAHEILAVDLSEEMLAVARSKYSSGKVRFVQADINQRWDFAEKQFDLITFSLVLEHIEELDHIFEQASKYLIRSGYVYLGELHPFKQYTGSKAKFKTENDEHIVTCFNHNISDFTHSARKYGLGIVSIYEYFDDDDGNTIPRILSIIFQKQ